MPYHLGDTIAAIATAPGGAARGIVRMSGPDALTFAARVFDSQPTIESCGRTCTVRGELRLPTLRSTIPAIAYLWPTARSFTREPIVELHLPGSPPLVEATLAAVCKAGARVAAPGEFALRAFLAGRFDLTEAEAMLGVIDAASGGQLETALAQLAGGLAKPLHQVRETLLDLLAHLEAGLDFVEEDIEFIGRAELVAGLEAARAILARLQTQLVGRRASDTAFRVVLVGQPNVGKSRLFNALARRDAALVSHEAGTTRDYLTARVDCDGLVCELTDTAGVEGEAEIAAQGHDDDAIRRAAQMHGRRERKTADLELLCIDASRPANDWERDALAQAGPAQIVVLTKCDLPRSVIPPTAAIETSGAAGQGLEELKAAIAAAAARLDAGTAVAATAVRCDESVRLANESLARARQLAAGGGDESLVAAEIRVALTEVAKMAGAVYTDDILDRIFSRFCIGK